MEGENSSIEKGLLLVNKEEMSATTTPLLVFSTFIIVSASFTYGAAMGYTADTMSSIMTDLDLSLAQFSLFGSLMTFGGMIGAIFTARAAAAFGHKMTLWLADLLCITGWLAIALAKNIIWLDIGRFLVGIGVGLLSYVVPVYVAEITPKHVRGAFTFSNQLLQNCGIATVYYFGNFLSWRTLALIGSIPCCIQVIGLFFVPESPRWLAKKGRDKEVEEVLQKLRGRRYDIVPEAREIKVSIEASKQNSNIGIRGLFRKRYAHQLTIGIGLMLLQQSCGTAGIGSYGSTLFNLAAREIYSRLSPLSSSPSSEHNRVRRRERLPRRFRRWRGAAGPRCFIRDLFHLAGESRKQRTTGLVERRRFLATPTGFSKVWRRGVEEDERGELRVTKTVRARCRRSWRFRRLAVDGGGRLLSGGAKPLSKAPISTPCCLFLSWPTGAPSNDAYRSDSSSFSSTIPQWRRRQTDPGSPSPFGQRRPAPRRS